MGALGPLRNDWHTNWHTSTCYTFDIDLLSVIRHTNRVEEQMLVNLKQKPETTPLASYMFALEEATKCELFGDELKAKYWYEVAEKIRLNYKEALRG